METLEKVIKMKPLSSTKSMDKGMLKRGKSNDNTRVGMPSRLRGVEDMSKLMNQEYMRDYL